MKLTKNTVIRATALILFFSMVAAIILYDGGAYDFSFVKRPTVYTTAADTTVGETTDPSETTGGDDTTVTQPPMNDDNVKEILEKLKTLDEMLKNGYSVSYDKFGSSSALAKTDAPYLSGDYSLTTHLVSKKVFYEVANGTLKTRKETKQADLPKIRLYYGYAIVNRGKVNAIFDKDRNQISEYLEFELTYQKTVDGMPIVKLGGSLFKISPEGLTPADNGEIKNSPINLDAPRYYAKSNIDLYPFAERVMELTQVGVVTTEPPATTPDTTDPEETSPDTTEGETTEGETTSGETTESETTTDVTTTPDTTDAPAVFNAREISDTTDTGTTADTTEGETTAPEESTPPEAEPNEGDIIEKDGKLYKVSYRILYGYKTSAGKVVIKPQYTMAYDFTDDGIACVVYEYYRLLFINTKGARVISLLDNPYVSPSDFNYKKHYQTFQSGINNDINDMGMYYSVDGCVMIRYTLMDAKTAMNTIKTVKLLYKKDGSRASIPGGFTLENYSDGVMVIQKDGRYGYLNIDNSWVAQAVFDEARPFFQGLAVCHTESGYGMIDTDGNTVLPFIFKYISDVSDGRVAAYSDEYGWQLFTVVSK